MEYRDVVKLYLEMYEALIRRCKDIERLYEVAESDLRCAKDDLEYLFDKFIPSNIKKGYPNVDLFIKASKCKADINNYLDRFEYEDSDELI